MMLMSAQYFRIRSSRRAADLDDLHLLRGGAVVRAGLFFRFFLRFPERRHEDAFSQTWSSGRPGGEPNPSPPGSFPPGVGFVALVVFSSRASIFFAVMVSF